MFAGDFVNALDIVFIVLLFEDKALKISLGLLSPLVGNDVSVPCSRCCFWVGNVEVEEWLPRLLSGEACGKGSGSAVEAEAAVVVDDNVNLGSKS